MTTGIETVVTEVLRQDGRVSSAWLFGSVVHGNMKPDSDIDLMVEMNDNKNYSFFDLLDIAYLIEKQIKRKVDIVEKGCLKDFALLTAQKDLLKIYG
jgi:predicted nucleotidyltransferase